MIESKRGHVAVLPSSRRRAALWAALAASGAALAVIGCGGERTDAAPGTGAVREGLTAPPPRPRSVEIGPASLAQTPHGMDPPPRHGRPPAAQVGPAPLHFEARRVGGAPQPGDRLDLWNPPAPQLRAPYGAQVLSAPRFVPVFYATDPNEPVVADFIAHLGASTFWSKTAEYGVGAGSSAPPVFRPEAAPATLSQDDIQAWIVSQVGAPGSFLPPPDPNNVYTLFFPADVTITMPGPGGVWKSCQQFGAYHSYAYLPSGAPVAYAVIPSCNGYLNLFGLDSITDAASHELVEAATDPYGYGYWDVDWQGSGWGFAFEGSAGAEVSDFCEFQPEVSVVDPELGRMVQRYYSNAAAAAWHDPCAPAPNRPYFNVLPIIGGTAAGPQQWTKGVAVAPGTSVTIPLKLFADAKTGPWKLSAAEGSNPHLVGDPWHQLSFAFDDDEGCAGDVRHLTITRSPRPDGAPLGPLPFAIVSTQGSVKNVWWVVVGQ